MQKTLHMCNGYKQQCVGGREFFWSVLQTAGVLVTIHQEHLHIIVHNLLVNDGDPF